jgi:phosphoenolpyruvate-protein kinase (PTS system EI component)
MSGEDISDVIVISRGGTTTFVAPVLSAGVCGLITLQGGPESHLGIVSREFSVPCVMSVAFTKGVQTSRGEIVPADGTVLRLETSATPDGAVYAKADA